MGSAVFTNDMSNDLGTIHSLIEVVEKALDENNLEKAKKGLHLIKQKTVDVAEYLKSTLQLEEDIPVRGFIEENLQTLKETHRLEINIRGKSGFNVMTKKIYLLKFLRNIFKNAAEAKATKMDIHFAETYIVFKDNGSGFDPKVLKNIVGGNISYSTKKATGTGLRAMNLFANSVNTTLDLSNSPLTQSAEIKISLKHLPTTKT